jgi:hypothetical protein
VCRKCCEFCAYYSCGQANFHSPLNVADYACMPTGIRPCSLSGQVASVQSLVPVLPQHANAQSAQRCHLCCTGSSSMFCMSILSCRCSCLLLSRNGSSSVQVSLYNPALAQQALGMLGPQALLVAEGPYRVRQQGLKQAACASLRQLQAHFWLPQQ